MSISTIQQCRNKHPRAEDDAREASATAISVTVPWRHFTKRTRRHHNHEEQDFSGSTKRDPLRMFNIIECDRKYVGQSAK